MNGQHKITILTYLYMNGFTLEAMSEATGWSNNTVYTRVSEYGLPAIRKSLRKDWSEAAQGYLQTHDTLEGFDDSDFRRAL
jgi:hypothetical protein